MPSSSFIGNEEDVSSSRPTANTTTANEHNNGHTAANIISNSESESSVSSERCCTPTTTTTTSSSFSSSSSRVENYINNGKRPPSSEETTKTEAETIIEEEEEASEEAETTTTTTISNDDPPPPRRPQKNKIATADQVKAALQREEAKLRSMGGSRMVPMTTRPSPTPPRKGGGKLQGRESSSSLNFGRPSRQLSETSLVLPPDNVAAMTSGAIISTSSNDNNNNNNKDNMMMNCSSITFTEFGSFSGEDFSTQLRDNNNDNDNNTGDDNEYDEFGRSRRMRCISSSRRSSSSQQQQKRGERRRTLQSLEESLVVTVPQQEHNKKQGDDENNIYSSNSDDIQEVDSNGQQQQQQQQQRSEGRRAAIEKTRTTTNSNGRRLTSPRGLQHHHHHPNNNENGGTKTPATTALPGGGISIDSPRRRRCKTNRPMNGRGGILLDMTGSTRSVLPSSRPGDDVAQHVAPPSTMGLTPTAIERKEREIAALTGRRDASSTGGDSNNSSRSANTRNSQDSSRSRRGQQQQQPRRSGGGDDQALPGAYSVPGPGAFSSAAGRAAAAAAAGGGAAAATPARRPSARMPSQQQQQQHLQTQPQSQPSRRTLPNSMTSRQDSRTVASSPRQRFASSLSNGSLIKAVLVEDIEEMDEQLSEREQQLQQQEQRLAEQQALLQAWEAELERKKRELAMLAASQQQGEQPGGNVVVVGGGIGPVVKAEVIEPERPVAHNSGGLRRMLFGGGGGGGQTGGGIDGSDRVGSSSKYKRSSSRSIDDDCNSEFHLPLEPKYVQEDSAREDAMDYARAAFELGPGPMRFSGQNERSFNEQVQEMPRHNKRVLKNLIQKWEDLRAKKRGHVHVLTKEWILRFARVTQSTKREGEFKEKAAWKAMRKLKRRYVRMNANGLEQQLRTKTLFPVPGLKTIDGQEMFYMKPARYFPKTTKTKAVIDNQNYVINTMLEREDPCNNGIGFIANMHDWEWTNFEVNYCLQFMLTLQSFNVPVRVEYFLIVDPPSWFGAIWKIMKPMLAPSFRKKVKVIMRDKLPRYLAPGFEEFLPDEMEGGQANTEQLVNDFVTYRKYYEWKLGGAHYSETASSPGGHSSRSNDATDDSHCSSMSDSYSGAGNVGPGFARRSTGSQISGISCDGDDGSVISWGQESRLSTGSSTPFETEDDDASFDGDLSLHSNVEGMDDDSDVDDDDLDIDVLEEDYIYE